MKKKKDTEKTELHNDFDVFDELGSGEFAPIEEDIPEVKEKEFEEKVPDSKDLAPDFLELAPDVPVNLAAVIGKTTTNIGELIKYRVGQVVDLKRTPGETVDLVANGRLVARGELVEMDGKLGVRILKMVK